MKKTAAVVLCAAMMLTACGGASTTETTAAGSQAAGSEAASSAEETKTASGDAQKLVLSTYGLSEDISEEEVYTPFENEFSCEIVTETGGTNDRYTKLAADPNSTIDVIELSQAMTAKGTDEGLFDTIDLSKIPNAEKLIPAAKEIAEAGQGVPYTINVTKNCANKELAYEYINYRISEELQTKTGKALNEAPTNKDVTFTEEESKDMTYGDKAAKVKVVDYAFVNPILNNWIDQWNRTINN